MAALHRLLPGGAALHRGRPDGAEPREPPCHREHERRYWCDAARHEGTERPQYEEDGREHGHAESHAPVPAARSDGEGRHPRESNRCESQEPVPGRSDGDLRHRRDWESRRGELEECELEEGELEEPKRQELRRGPAEHRGRNEQPYHDEQSRYAARGDKRGRGLPNPDHRLAPPRAGGAPRQTGDAGGALRAPPSELVTGRKRDRKWECERDREWVVRREQEWARWCSREHHDERQKPERRNDRGMMHAFGAHAGRLDATAVRNDHCRHDEQRVYVFGDGVREHSHADHHRAPPLAPTAPARFTSAPPGRALLRANAAAGTAREPETLERNKQLNQRLAQARGTSELLRLHSEHGGSFNNVNLATCAPHPHAPTFTSSRRHSFPAPKASTAAIAFRPEVLEQARPGRLRRGLPSVA